MVVVARSRKAVRTSHLHALAGQFLESGIILKLNILCSDNVYVQIVYIWRQHLMKRSTR